MLGRTWRGALTASAVAAGAIALSAAGVSAHSDHHGLGHDGRSTAIKHVLLISVDGMHQSDLDWYVQNHPDSELAKLAASHSISGNAAALWLCSLAFLVAFAVKVPIFPLHGWLGDALSEAPTAMAMVLAGKLGLYSILRFNLGLFPAQSRQVAPWMIALAAIGVLYGALVALVQKDLKRLMAFATVSSLSFCTLGIFCFAVSGLDGAVYQILNEGISVGALLLLLGFMYERYGTYDIATYGGLSKPMPWLSTLFVFTTLSLIGLPLLNGFVAEFLILSGSFPGHVRWVVAATAGVILSASYMLWMVQRVFYGSESGMVADLKVADIGFREQIAVWPMAVLMLLMGVASPYWMRAIDDAVVKLSAPAPEVGIGMAAKP